MENRNFLILQSKATRQSYHYLRVGVMRMISLVSYWPIDPFASCMFAAAACSWRDARLLFNLDLLAELSSFLVKTRGQITGYNPTRSKLCRGCRPRTLWRFEDQFCCPLLHFRSGHWNTPQVDESSTARLKLVLIAGVTRKMWDARMYRIGSNHAVTAIHTGCDQ